MKKVLYINTIFLPSILSGSERLTYQFTRACLLDKKDFKPYVITSDVSKRIGFFLPFIGRYKKGTEVLDGIHILRLKHNWFYYLLSQILVKGLGIILKFPLLKREAIYSLNRRITSFAYGPTFVDLERAIKEIKPDIIHLTPLPNAYIYQTVRILKKLNKGSKKKIKLIITPSFHFHDEVFKTTYDKVNTYMVLKYADFIICTTEFEKGEIIRNFQIAEDKIRVINIGIAKKGYSISHDSNSLIPSTTDSLKGINEEIAKINKVKGIVILFIGTRTAGKGIFQLIKAVSKLRIENNNQKILLLVGGQKTLIWNIKYLVFKLRGQIDFLINLPYLTESDKLKIFSESDIFAMPSVVDSYGIVYLEAMMHGIPIIYADEPPQKEIVNGAGEFVAFNDIDGLADLIKKFKDKNIRTKYGLIGKERYEHYFTQDRMVGSVLEVYKQLI